MAIGTKGYLPRAGHTLGNLAVSFGYGFPAPLVPLLGLQPPVIDPRAEVTGDDQPSIVAAMAEVATSQPGSISVRIELTTQPSVTTISATLAAIQPAVFSVGVETKVQPAVTDQTTEIT
jgi:hypothetical protein